MFKKRAVIYAALFSLVLLISLRNQDFVRILDRVHPKTKDKALSVADFNQLVHLCHAESKSDACLSVGYVYLRGVFDERDPSRAVGYFERACDLMTDPNQKAFECEAISQIFRLGREARVDVKIAALFHEKAEEAKLNLKPKTDDDLKVQCESGHGASCVKWAKALLQNPVVDVHQIEDLLDKACAKTSSKDEEFPGKVCGMVAEIFEFGKSGLPLDLTKAGQFYRRACELGVKADFANGFMCDLAGTFFKDKAKSPVLAASYYAKACRAKYTESCERLKEVSPQTESL